MGDLISKSRLNNFFTQDSNITPLQTTNPQLHTALKNFSDASKQLVNSVFPPPPIVNYKGRIILPGTQSVATDVLSHRYHVVLPIDPSGYWTYTSITLTNVFITAKTVPLSSPLSIDVLIAKNKGQTAFQSIFKSGANPQLPVNVATTHDVYFAINQLYQDDLGRVDVLAADGTAANIEIVLVGNYNYTENNVP